jgi:hypothetical protein
MLQREALVVAGLQREQAGVATIQDILMHRQLVAIIILISDPAELAGPPLRH